MWTNPSPTLPHSGEGVSVRCFSSPDKGRCPEGGGVCTSSGYYSVSLCSPFGEQTPLYFSPSQGRGRLCILLYQGRLSWFLSFISLSLSFIVLSKSSLTQVMSPKTSSLLYLITTIHRSLITSVLCVSSTYCFLWIGPSISITRESFEQ